MPAQSPLVSSAETRAASITFLPSASHAQMIAAIRQHYDCYNVYTVPLTLETQFKKIDSIGAISRFFILQSTTNAGGSIQVYFDIHTALFQSFVKWKRRVHLMSKTKQGPADFSPSSSPSPSSTVTKRVQSADTAMSLTVLSGPCHSCSTSSVRGS